PYQAETLVEPAFTPESGALQNATANVSPSEYRIAIDINSLSRIRGNLQSFLSSKSSAEAECKRILGLDRPDLPCTDMQTCQKACYTPICQPFAAGAGEPFLKSMADLSAGTKALEDEVSSSINLVDLMASNTNDIRPGDIELLENRLANITSLSAQINANDILNPNAYALCAPFKYDTSLISNSKDIASTAKIQVTFTGANQSTVTLTAPVSFSSPAQSSTDYYEYTNIFLLNSNTSGSQLKSVQLVDSLPSKLNVPIESVTYPTNYSSLSQFPLSVQFKIVEIGGSGIGRTLSYSFNSKVPIDGAFAAKSVPTPAVSLSVVSLYSMPVVAQLLQNSSMLYSIINPALGFYLSLAIIAFLLFILVVRVAWSALRLVYAVFTGLMAKARMDTVIYDFAGHANKDNNIYFAVGILLIGAGYYLSLGPAVPNSAALDPDFALATLSADPVRAFGGVLFLFGLISLYLVIEDILKGVVLGKKYTTIPNLVSHNDNVER
ncbi:MAG TPA: hypothetical protein PLO51_04590, partial [Candidatus Micrarchaeota archaeon]|nr:hypothetical protein [Candidatus Micrarchaeota archaeon]